MTTFTEIVLATLSKDGPPIYEPVRRNKDGMRWIKHRFPIKGGITQREVLARSVTASNALFARFYAK